MGHQKESDARIVIDDLLRKAGWDPADKSMVETEVLVSWPAGAARDSAVGPDDASASADRDTFGRADYLLRDQRGRALAIIEAKKSNADDLIRRFKRDDYPQVAVSVGMLDTGFDCREVLHLVMCRRARSPILYQQMRGRGTRTAPHIGKAKFVIYDFFGNHEYFDDSDTDIFSGAGGGYAGRPGPTPPPQPRSLVELGLQDEWLHAVTYVEVGPEGERVDKRDYITNWERTVRAAAVDDPVLSKVRNGELLTEDEERSLAERFRWQKWRFLSGAPLVKFVRDEVFPYMASLVRQEPQIAEYFRDAILEIVDPNVLKQVVDEIDGIGFARLGTDVKGDIFEYLLTHLGQSALNGQFRTPRQIRTMMVEMSDPDLGDTVYDPACGTGGFLIDAVEHILAKYSTEPQEVPIYGEEWLEKRGQSLAEARAALPTLQTYRKGPGEKIPDWQILERSIHGIDVSRQMMRIAAMNLVLHGIRKANVKRANTLSDMGGLSEDDLARRYKVILSNPPFAGVLPKESIRKDLPTNSKKSELLFLAVIMEALAPGGTCAVVVPEGLLFGSTGAHVELRRKLVENYELLAVVSLPAGVFKPYAGVKTGVLVFRRPTTAAAKNAKANRLANVWFYEIRADGYDPDKIQGGGRPETPERNDIPDLLAQWRLYKKSGFKKPPGIKAGAVLPEGTAESRCWWTTVDALTEDFSLAAGRYKPQIAEPAPEGNPAQLIRETLALEREIVTGLEKLLKEIEG